jgi:hypothetical protein
MDRRHAYGAGIALVGVVFAVVQTLHGLEQSDWILVLAFEAGPFVLLSLALVYTGYWLAVNDDFDGDMPRVVAWGVGSTILFASIAALMLFSQRVALGTLERASYIAIDLATTGAVVGTLVGLYDVRGQQRLRALERERDRVRAFANKAADVNNYGRALTRSESLDDVSGLVIEAMSTLLGISDAAVMVVEGDRIRTIDNTVVGISEDALAEVAERTLDEDEGTFVTHEDVPSELTDFSETTVSILLLSEDDHAVVLVALDDSAQVGEEDVELVEMLASHARTALARNVGSDEGVAADTGTAG